MLRFLAGARVASSLPRWLRATLLVLASVTALWPNPSQLDAAAPANRDPVPANLPASPAPKVLRYADRLVERYDANHDGSLQENEWRPMAGNPEQIDRDGDQLLSADEIARYVAAYAIGRSLAPAYDPVIQSSSIGQASSIGQFPAAESASNRASAQRSTQAAAEVPASDKPYYVPKRFLPQALPDWFLAQDANGDGQLSLSEYAGGGEAEQTAQFERLDRNDDGLITPAELLAGPVEATLGNGVGSQDKATQPTGPGDATSAQ